MADESDRCCRICFSSEETISNRLFRPCLCRGSMRYVHMECLDTWRQTSANPQSFFQCDQCKFKYHLGQSDKRFFWARCLSKPWAIEGLAIGLLFMTIFFGGFFAKMLDSSLTWYEILDAFNLKHYLYGSLATGLVSVVSSATTMVGGGFGIHFLEDAWRDQRSGDIVGMVILAVAAVVGLCYCFSFIYSWLQQHATRVARMAQSVVLDVQGDAEAEGQAADEQVPRPPPARPAQQYAPVD